MAGSWGYGEAGWLGGFDWLGVVWGGSDLAIFKLLIDCGSEGAGYDCGLMALLVGSEF